MGWYTAGGFVDECGVKHASGLYYQWPLLSVLNEDEYSTPPGTAPVIEPRPRSTTLSSSTRLLLCGRHLQAMG